LTVRIADENEFAPMFSPTTYIVNDFSESSAAGSSIVKGNTTIKIHWPLYQSFASMFECIPWVQ